MMTIIIFILALSVLVFVHEWGHFIIAKLSGVRVDIFSIGFGPKIFSCTWHGTEYRLAPIPFGGYVKIFGQEPYEEAEGDAKKAEEIAKDPESFYSKSILKKMATVFAGPTMNVLLCFLLLPIVFMVGRLQPKILIEPPVVIDVIKDSPAQQVGLKKGDLILSVQGGETASWKDLLTRIALYPDQEIKIEYERDGVQKEILVSTTVSQNLKQTAGGMIGIEPFAFYGNDPVIDSVQAGMPAFQAGFQSGDRVIRIDDQPIKSWTEMTQLIQESHGKKMFITVLREGQEVQLSITPEYNKEEDVWIMGVTKQIDQSNFVKVRYGLVESVSLGFKEGAKLFTLTLDILQRLFTGELSFKTLGGPIQIAQATSSAAKSGFGDFLYLLAFLSLQLGILNLLPIPVLDGGHLVFMTIEAVIRKPLPPKVRSVSMQLGFVMLIGLMLAVTYNDLTTFPGFLHVIESIKGIF